MQPNKFQIKLSSKSPANIFAYICIILMFTPIIRQFYIVQAFIISLIFFALSFSYFLDCFGKNRIIQLASIMLLIEIIYKLIGVSTVGFGNYAYRTLRFISVWLAFYIMDYTDKQTQKRMFNVMLLALIVNLIDNIRLWMFDTRASEIAYRYANSVGKINIGRVDWQYCIGFLFLILLAFMFLKKDEMLKNKYSVLVFIALCLSGYYIIFYAHSTTLVLSVLFAVFLLLIFRKQRTQSQIIIRLFALLFLFVILILLRNFAIDLLIDWAEKLGRDKTMLRLNDIKILLSGGNTSIDEIGSMARLEMIGIDIKSWLSNVPSFLFGRGFHFEDYSNVITAAINNYSGNHSALVDILPRYGIIGFGIYISILYSTRKYLMSHCQNNTRSSIMIIWGFLLFSMVFNDPIKHNVIFFALFSILYLFKSPIGEDG